MRRLLVLPATLALAAGLTACGDEPVTAIDVVRAAAAATADAETARVEVTLDGRLAATASMDARLDGSEMVGTLEAMGITVNTRQVDGVLYLELPGQSGWIGFDLDQAAQQAGVPGLFDGATAGASALDGTAALSRLQQVSEVTAEGEDTIDGVATERYAVVIDAQAALDSVVPGNTATLPPAASDEVQGTLWIDGNDLVRRLVVEDPNVGRVQLDIVELGVPVDVEAPPADQVRMAG
jgi:hypothetical protein